MPKKKIKISSKKSTKLGKAISRKSSKSTKRVRTRKSSSQIDDDIEKLLEERPISIKKSVKPQSKKE